MARFLWRGVALPALLRGCQGRVADATATWAHPRSVGVVAASALLRGCADRVAETIAMRATPQKVSEAWHFRQSSGAVQTVLLSQPLSGPLTRGVRVAVASAILPSQPFMSARRAILRKFRGLSEASIVPRSWWLKAAWTTVRRIKTHCWPSPNLPWSFRGPHRGQRRVCEPYVDVPQASGRATRAYNSCGHSGRFEGVHIACLRHLLA